MNLLLPILAAAATLSLGAAESSTQWRVADTNLADYFARETRTLSERCLAEVKTADDWRRHASEYRGQLAEMLGLAPLPARTDLQAKVTQRLEHDTFTVENLHFQSRPGLYVTANLYVPKNLARPAPAILYVCGHAPVVTNGVSYGTKAAYQHHGIWFARNGYVCLVIDTLESGEILGEHHGTYRAGLWWWNARGYTPAGVETWNGLRALDYLSTRPEVDTNRFGITGRSGGGAYSWFITAMDDRIKAAAPVAGITDLENHVVDGAVEGHCDCMFFVNTHRWDYPQLAALAAPRPLLLGNTDADSIFPLDGVVRLHSKVRRIYRLLGADEKLGLVITPGPHKDTQELQVPVMRWFNHHLKGDETSVENAALKLFSPQQLKVFETLPADALNANIHATFVDVARAKVAESKAEWAVQRDEWVANLRAKSFAAWPGDSVPAELRPAAYAGERVAVGANAAQRFDIAGTSASLRIARPAGGPAKRITLLAGVQREAMPDETTAVVEFQGLEGVEPKKLIQIRRRFMLLGETLDSRRVWEIVRIIQAMRKSSDFGRLPLHLEADGDMAVNALYASLFAPVDELVLSRLPASQVNGPDYLNVLRILDLPQAVAMASERARVEIRGANAAQWAYATQTARNLGWETNLLLLPENFAPLTPSVRE